MKEIARKRAALEREAARIAAELAEIDKFEKMYDRLRGKADPRTGSATSEIIEGVDAILRETGRAMSRTELLRALDARGVTISGKDRGRYLSTLLWRHRDRFRNQRGRGYWFAQPFEVAA